jgi:acyl-coenzyme A thioesterase PaaI-like protein
MCGIQNPLGLKLNFTKDDQGGVVGHFTPNQLLEGYSGILHGGVAAALLDSAMTNCLFIRNIIALTGELNIRYLNPIPTNKEIMVKACVSKSTPPLFNLESTLFVDNILMARAAARFMESSETKKLRATQNKTRVVCPH